MTIHALALKQTNPEQPIRTTAQVYTYTGPDTDSVLSDLIRTRFTGPITLHVSAGRVASIEWREKLRTES